MNRRNMLKLSSAVALGGIVGNVSAHDAKAIGLLPAPESYSCLVKHGWPGSDTDFTWSVLTVRSGYEEIRLNLENLKETERYRSELKFSSNDKFKERVSKLFIDAFITYHISLNLIVVKSDPTDLKKLSPMQFEEKILGLYENVLQIEGMNRDLVHKSESLFGPSRQFQNTLKNTFGINQIVSDSKIDVFMQMNDLISGIIHSIIFDKKPKSSVKSRINDYLLSKYDFNYRDKPHQLGDLIRLRYINI